MSMEDLSSVLWRERDLLELLLFKLEVEQLVLTSGRTHWLAVAAREVETVLARDPRRRAAPRDRRRRRRRRARASSPNASLQRDRRGQRGAVAGHLARPPRGVHHRRHPDQRDVAEQPRAADRRLPGRAGHPALPLREVRRRTAPTARWAPTAAPASSTGASDHDRHLLLALRRALRAALQPGRDGRRQRQRRQRRHRGVRPPPGHRPGHRRPAAARALVPLGGRRRRRGGQRGRTAWSTR